MRDREDKKGVWSYIDLSGALDEAHGLEDSRLWLHLEGCGHRVEWGLRRRSLSLPASAYWLKEGGNQVALICHFKR